MTSHTVHWDAMHSLLNDMKHLIAKREIDSQSEGWREEQDELKEVLLALSSVLGPKLFEKALMLSGKRDVITEFRAAQSERSVFKVKGETGEYRVLRAGFCTCKSFEVDRIPAHLPLCKHILAVELALVQKTVKVVTVLDSDWAKYAGG